MPDPMRLSIIHTTRYRYDAPVAYGLQQLRLTPKSHNSQNVTAWTTEITGGRRELSFDDANANRVDLISTDAGATELVIRCEGQVEIEDTNGIIGRHAGYMPLWMFERVTQATRPGPRTRDLVKSIDADLDPLPRLHALSTAIRERVAYQTGISEINWSAEDVLEAECGVCQDHAHTFLAAARLMGAPARYVSGYLMMNDRVDQDATHAWVEAFVQGLGWIGFDISNGISPDTRYVRVATGLDYFEAAPISGTRYGQGGATLDVAVEVLQQ